MKNLKKKYPYSDGWIHAKFTLTEGHDLTPKSLSDNIRSMGADEIAHCEIDGRKAIVIYREKPRSSSADE